MDDGTGPDRAAGDGVFSLSFSARSSLSEGEMSVMIRATDVFLSTTAIENQWHNITIVKSSSGSSGGSWVEENSMQLILASLGSLLVIGVGAFVYIVRNSEID